MKRGMIFLLLVLVLLVGCQLIREDPKSAVFSKRISVVEMTGSSGDDVDDYIQAATGVFGGLVGVNVPNVPSYDDAFGGVFIGNFQLTMDVVGKMQEWNLTYNGQIRQVKAYKLDAINIGMIPYPFMYDLVYFRGAGAGWKTPELSRVKVLDLSYIQFNEQGDIVRTTLVRLPGYPPEDDTLTGKSTSKVVKFSDTYVPPDFTITLTFDVGLASSSEDVPAAYPAVQAALPYPVSWQPFSNEDGTDSQLSSLTGLVYGYVYDSLNKAPVKNREVSIEFSDGGPRTLLTDSKGYYETVVPLTTNRAGVVIEEPYKLVFDGCQQAADYCDFNSIVTPRIEDVFKRSNPGVNFDYGPGCVHYPSPEDYYFVEGENGKLYWAVDWVNDKIGNRERQNHDFILRPAPPAAYLNCPSSAKKNEVITFYGVGAVTYDTLVKWVLDFGDGKSVEGAGASASASHTYLSDGQFIAKLIFCEANGRCSPAYTKKIVVGSILPVAVIDSVTPSPLYLSLDENNDLIPGTVKVKAHATHPDNKPIIAWQLSSFLVNLSGSGSSFEKSVSFDGIGNRDIKVRFKDNAGVWSDWVTKSLVVKQGNVTGALRAEAQVEHTDYVDSAEDGVVPGTTVNFYGTGYSPDGNTIVKYKWDFNNDGVFDSVSGSKGAVSYVYKTSGVYTAKFVVEDNKGNTAFKEFTIPVLDVSVNFDIGGGNTADEGSSITMSSTLFNNDRQKDVKVKECIMAWYQYNNGQYTFWHNEVAFTNACKGIGSVRARNNKVLWKETETVCCPGKQKVNIQVRTQYGVVETTFFKTVNHVDRVNLSSTQNSCNIPGTINLLVSSNMLNTNCNLELSLNNGPWIASGSAATDNTGYLYFTPACTTPGNYRARAVCGSVTSNVFSFAAVGQGPQPPPPQPPGNESPQPPQPVTEYSGTVDLMTNRPEYSQAKLFAGEEVILYLLSSSDLPTGAKCDLYTRYASGGDWKKLGVIPTSQHSGSFRLGGQGLRINAGTWLAKAICKNLHTRETAYNVLGSFLPETSMPNPHVPESFEPQSVPSKSGTDSSASSSFGKLTGRSRLTSRVVSDVGGEFFAAEVLFLGILGLIVMAAFLVFRKN